MGLLCLFQSLEMYLLPTENLWTASEKQAKVKCKIYLFFIWGNKEIPLALV